MTARRRLEFPLSEYERRLAAVQSQMQARDVDLLVLTDLSSICYLSGFQTLGSYGYGLYALLVPPTGVPVLFASDFESHNAQIDSWLDDVVVYAVQDPDPVSQLVALIRKRGLNTGRIACEQGHFALTIRQFRGLEAGLTQAQIIEPLDLLEQVRLVKSDPEIAALRRAAALTTAGARAGIDAVRAGAADNDVAAAVSAAIIAGGGEYFSIQPIVTSGARSGIPHSTFRRQELRPGDAVFLEVVAAFRRYSAPTLRSICIGAPAPEVQRAFDGCRASVQTMLEHLRAGANGRDAARQAGAALRAVVPDLIWHGYYGYSVGLSFPPACSDCQHIGDITEDRDFPLQAGMVFHCSTSLRKLGEFGVTVGDTVLITEAGCEVLTGLEPRLHIREG